MSKSSTGIVSAVHIATSSKEARDQIYSQLQEVLAYSSTNEPGVVKYAICVPDDASDSQTSIYIFEEYANRVVYDAHMSSKPVLALLDLLQDSSLVQSLSVKHLAWIPDALLSRPKRLPTGATHDLRDRVENPYVLWATITDPSTADIDALAPYGAAIVQYARESEPDTLFYADARTLDLTPEDASDDEKGGFIAALEVYASKAACFAHLQDESVKALAAEGKRLESTFTIVRLNMVGGWLTRA